MPHFIYDDTGFSDQPKTDLTPIGSRDRLKRILAENFNTVVQYLNDLKSFARGGMKLYKTGDPTVNCDLKAFSGTPNGTLASTKGSLCVDVATPGLYQNQDGANSWSSVAGGGGGSSSSFVFQPGGSAGGNVFTDWALLCAAIAAVQGTKFVEFDNQFSATCHVTAGTWDMKDVVWSGLRNDAFTIAKVQFDTDAVVTNLREIRRLFLVVQGATAPILDMAEGDVFILADGAFLSVSDTVGPLIDLTAFAGAKLGGVSVSLRDGARMFAGFSTPTIYHPNDALLTIDVDSSSRLEPNSIAGSSASARIDITADGAGNVQTDQAAFPGTVTIKVNPGRFNVAPVGDSAQAGYINRYDVSGGGSVDVSLPAALGRAGEIIIFKNTSSDADGTIGILPDGVDTIDGLPQYNLTGAYASATMICNGVDGWSVESVSTGNIGRLLLSTDVALLAGHLHVLDPTGAPIAATLPLAADNAGQIVVVKNNSASVNAITVGVTGGDTVDGGATAVINTARGVLRFASNGANWMVI